MMTEEKRRYVLLMIEDLFEAHFVRAMETTDLAKTLHGFDPKSAASFRAELSKVFKSDFGPDDTLQTAVEAAYEASKDTLLTADAIVAQPPKNDPFGADSDENAHYFRMLGEIEKGLLGLADEVYAALKGKREKAQVSVILERSKEKLRLYDLFIPTLDADSVEEAEDVLKDDIDFLRESIAGLEAAAAS
jgi:hypothetical protein